MTEFWIDTKQLLNITENFRKMAADFRAEYDALKSLDIPPLGSARGDIVARLDAIKAEYNDTINSIQVMADALEHIAYIYRSTDEKVAAFVTSSTTQTNDSFLDDKADLRENSEQEVSSISGNASAMVELFDFLEEEERALKEAYEKYNLAAENLGWSYEKKIHMYFSITAALIPDYSSASTVFNYIALSPSTDQAIGVYDAMKLNFNGKEMQEILKNQHGKDKNLIKRDFAHEFATIAVLSCDGFPKYLAGWFDNIDAMGGYKGDVYSGSMDKPDMYSDIAAFNIYNRIIKSENGNIWEIMSEYNEGAVDGTINECLEFLENYGGGDAKKGMSILEEEMYDESLATWYLKIDDDNKIKKMLNFF